VPNHESINPRRLTQKENKERKDRLLKDEKKGNGKSLRRKKRS